MQSFFLLILGALLFGCAQGLPDHVALEPAANDVDIAMDPPSADDYKLVGEVTGEAAAADLDMAEQAAKNDLRNRAAALGASLVTVDDDTGEPVMLEGKTRVTVSGRAYKPVE